MNRSDQITQPGQRTVTTIGNWYLSGRLDETEEIRRFEIYSSPYSVGRRSGANLSIPVNCISKYHAELLPSGNELWVRDLGSTNGTYVNGSRLSKQSRLVEGDLLQFASMVFRVGRNQDYKDNHTQHEDACDRAMVMMQFDRLISDGGVVPFFQPIVTIEKRETIGFEVLGRSGLFGLKTPNEMFSAASRLNLEIELSQLMRHEGAKQGKRLPTQANIFVNTHPAELAKDGLAQSLEQLRSECPDHNITLEIHEAAITDSKQIVTVKRILDDLGMFLAFDDFGVGRARLVEISDVRPDFVKFDMRLTRDIHRASAKRQEVVALIVKMVNDLGIASLAEGIESEACHQVIEQMRFRLGQGFLYGRPAPLTRYLHSNNCGQLP